MPLGSRQSRSLLFQCGNWGLERLRDLLKAKKKAVSGGTQMQWQVRRAEAGHVEGPAWDKASPPLRLFHLCLAQSAVLPRHAQGVGKQRVPRNPPRLLCAWPQCPTPTVPESTAFQNINGVDRRKVTVRVRRQSLHRGTGSAFW